VAGDAQRPGDACVGSVGAGGTLALVHEDGGTVTLVRIGVSRNESVPRPGQGRGIQRNRPAVDQRPNENVPRPERRTESSVTVPRYGRRGGTMMVIVGGNMARQPGPGVRRRRTLIGIGAGVGVLVLALVAYVIVINVQEQALYTEPSPTTEDIGPYVDGATATVRTWLDALSAGDAGTALAMMDFTGDRTYLTDQALAGAAPVFGNVQIERLMAVPENVLLHVTFTIQGQAGDLQLAVDNQDPSRPAGPWRIRGGTCDVDADLVMGRHLDAGLVINGIPAPAGATTLTLFPGVYPLTVADPWFTFPPGNTTLVVPVFTSPVFAYDLSALGQARIAADVQATLDTCLAETVAVPEARCGFGFKNPVGIFGRAVAIASVAWSVVPGASDRPFEYRYDPATKTATARGSLTIQGDVISVEGVPYVGTDHILTITVGLADRDHPVVTLSR